MQKAAPRLCKKKTEKEEMGGEGGPEGLETLVHTGSGANPTPVPSAVGLYEPCPSFTHVNSG